MTTNYIDEIVLEILKPFVYKKYGKIYIGHKETEGALRYEGLAIQLKQKLQEVEQRKVEEIIEEFRAILLDKIIKN